MLTREPAEPQGFRVDLEGMPVDLPPHLGGRPPVLYGDAELDEDGRISSVTWTQSNRVRPRTRPKRGASRSRHTVELWDYGLPVDIEIPELQPKQGPRELIGLARELRRRKRAWERRHER